MIGITLSLAAIIALGVISVYFLLKTFQQLQPGRKKVQQDLQRLKSDLQPLVADLVPWSKEEMEQLSLNQVNKTGSHKMSKQAKGVFTTIYHEPVIAWSYKGYLGKAPNALVYARTSSQEFIYRLKNGETEIVIGDQLVGKLDANGTLLAHANQKPIAQVSAHKDKRYLPVKVNNRTVASIAKSEWDKKPNPRAFNLLGDMDKQEEELFLSLALLEMLKPSLR